MPAHIGTLGPIRDNIPFPPHIEIAQIREQMEKLEIGQSFDVTGWKTVGLARQAMYAVQRKSEKTFTTQKLADGEIRIWRVT